MRSPDYEAYKYTGKIADRHGSRWASEEEMTEDLYRMRLSDDRHPFHGGLPVISDGDEMYVDDSDVHNLIIGSTGSKKTRLFAMPMLETFLRAGESVVVTDPKGELYDLTARKFADSGYRLFVVNLRDPARSHGWNPFFLARQYYSQGKKEEAAILVNDFAETMILDGKSRDPFWDQTSRSLLRGMIMMMVEDDTYFPDDTVTPVTLRMLSKYIKEEDDPGITYDLVTQYPDDSIAKSNLDAVVRGSEKTFSNICVCYDSDMQGLYIQNALVDMLSRNEVDFYALGQEKTILYLIMPDEKTTMHMIVSMMIKQCYIQLIDLAQRDDRNTLPVRVNFLLDEFSNLPEIPDMSAMISAARSRNIRFHLIIQGLYQLVDKYGPEAAQTIKGNCGNWVFLTSRELPLLEEISALCGNDDSGNRLISTTQLQRLDKNRGEAVILLGRHAPFIAHLPDISEYYGYQKPAQRLDYPVNSSGKVVRLTRKHLEKYVTGKKGWRL